MNNQVKHNNKLFINCTEDEILNSIKEYIKSGEAPKLPLEVKINKSEKINITPEQAAYESYRFLQRNKHNKLYLNDDLKYDFKYKEPDYDSCIQGITVVAVDCLGIVLSIFGLASSTVKTVSGEIIAKLSNEEIVGFKRQVAIIASPASSFYKATAVVRIVYSAMDSVGGFGTILDMIKNAMSIWDWIALGSSVTIQLTAFFTTEGAAEIAEIALMAVALTSTGIDASEAILECERSHT